jgi:hypothetical protein
MTYLNVLSIKNTDYFYLQDNIIQNFCRITFWIFFQQDPLLEYTFLNSKKGQSCEYFSCSLFPEIFYNGNYLAGQNDVNSHLYNDSISKFWWADFISLFVIDIFLFFFHQ